MIQRSIFRVTACFWPFVRIVQVSAETEAEAEKDAENKHLAYKSVIRLEHLHRIYETIVNERKTAIQALTPVAELEERTKSAIEEADNKIYTALQQTIPREGTKLDLSGLLISGLPSSLLSLRSTLVTLNLSNNCLESLPESVTSFGNLISLDVHSNQLKSLPNSIGRLVKLKVLNVSGNYVHVLPESLANCRALEELSANFNRLERLPESLGHNLTKLQKLSVHSNKLSYLPDSISRMMSLRVLDVHLNKLRSLPADIGKLIYLETLNISKNFQCLVVLPESIGRINSLRELDVSYNQITILPGSIGDLEKLQNLVVEGNPLVVPPPEVVEHSVQAVKTYLGELSKVNTIRKKRNERGGASWLRYLGLGRRWGYGKQEDAMTLLGEKLMSLDECQRAEGSSRPRGCFCSARFLPALYPNVPTRSLSTPHEAQSRFALI